MVLQKFKLVLNFFGIKDLGVLDYLVDILVNSMKQEINYLMEGYGKLELIIQLTLL